MSRIARLCITAIPINETPKNDSIAAARKSSPPDFLLRRGVASLVTLPIRNMMNL
jgi:hypothetical protein